VIKLVLLLRPCLAPRKHAFSLSTACGDLGVHGVVALQLVALLLRHTLVKFRLLLPMVAVLVKVNPPRQCPALYHLVLLTAFMDLGAVGVHALSHVALVPRLRLGKL